MVKKVLLFLILSGFFSVITSQTFLLDPPKGYFLDNPTQLKLKLFFPPEDSLILEWGQNVTGLNAELKIGQTSGNYDIKTIPVTGQTLRSKSGISPYNLSTGRYYAIISNSQQNTLSGIQNDFNNNPTSIIYTNEIQFVVEAQTAPVALSPSGVIEEATPVFEWTSVPGVPAYYLFVSSTPFSVVTLPNGEISVEGANIIWNFLTTETSVQYGEPDLSSPYYIEAPPLIPGFEYNYAILNLYDEDDLSFTSTVFGGAVQFIYEAPFTLNPPQLTAPADSSIFYGDEYISFQWDEIEDANSYTIYLYQRVTTFAGNQQQIDIPIWNSTTTNTSIEYPALTTLNKGNYIWFVVPNDISGAGNASETWFFRYVLDVGKFVIQAVSTANGTNFLNFEAEANAVSGGVSPANPYVVTNSQTYTDSLVVGTYEFTGSKPGHFDSTFSVNINQDVTTSIVLYLRPYPTVISGVVKDQAGAGVSSANVRFENILTNVIKNTTSNSQGNFSLALPKGTYNIQASKAGYLASQEITVTAETDQLILSSPLVLTLDNTYISGKVFNDLNQPVQLASVKAQTGNVVQQVTTDASGNYSFTLSSGEWTLTTTKTGFISPDPSVYTLVAGDNLQNENFTLIPKANQVTGFVYKVTTQGQTPFQDVTVTAVPGSGIPVTSVTSSSGQFSLSLRSGSYTISAAKQGYTASQPIQLTLGVGQTISGLNFEMTANPSSIAGSVTKSDGTALGGVTVYTLNGEQTTTLPNGTYQLSVAAGTRTVNIQKSGYISPQPLTISVSPGQNLTGINFTMSANAGVITGKVTSLQQPLVNATVKAILNDQTVTATTGSDGKYLISVQPGTYSLTALKSGFVTSDPHTLTIGPGQQSANNNFNLVANTAVVQGTITKTGGSPLTNASIVLKESNAPENSYSTVSGAGGAYAVTVTAGKVYDIEVSKTGYSEFTGATGTLQPGSSATVDAILTPNPSSVSGKIYNNLQQLMASVQVKIYDSGNNLVKTLVTGSQGKYSTGLSAGSYKIKSSAAGHLPDSAQITLQLGQNLTNITLTLTQNFAFLSGIVKDQNGTNLTGVTVNLTSATGGATAVTGASGNYVISGLYGGAYNISMTKQGYATQSITDYVIRDGESKELNGTLTELTGSITGTVSDINSELIEGASVFFENSATGETFNKISAADGSFSITSLEFGTYIVHAIKTGYSASSEKSATISVASQNATVTLNDMVPHNAVIGGVVKDNYGNFLGSVQVSVSGDLGSGSAVTNTSGVFSIGGLAPGTYLVKTLLDGYSSDDMSVNVTTQADLEIFMLKNSSSLSGTVKDETGLSPGFTVPVYAVTESQLLFSAQSDLNGNFEIDDIPYNTEYLIYTDIFKEGYSNDTTTIFIPEGAPTAGPVNLVLSLNQSRINGNCGISGAAIKITKSGTDETYTVTSGSDGDYSKSYLKDGGYTVTPSREGYQFTPSTQSTTLLIRDTVTVDFDAVPNIGTMTVVTKLSNGTPLEEVAVSVVSADESIVRNGFTGADGQLVFEELPSAQYLIRPVKENYTASPEQSQVTITAGASLTGEFTFTENNASITGTVFRLDNGNKIAFADINVKLVYKNTGQSFFRTSGGAGSFSFENIPPGDVLITGIKGGFISDTLEFAVQAGQSYQKELTMRASVVHLVGNVFYRSSAVAGVNISATSSSSFSERSGSSGRYVFLNLPIKQGANDTTIYSIAIDDPLYPPLGQIIRIPSTAAGNTLTIDDFLLPSGKVTLRFSDGYSNMPGVKVSFSRPDGSTETGVTTSNGLFVSDSNLTSGTYKVSLEKLGYLIPDELSNRVELETDTSNIRQDILLPFTFSPVDSVFANQPAEIKIGFTFSGANDKAYIYYRQESALNYSKIPMTLGTGEYTGSIPALYSLEKIYYYVEVTRVAENIIYKSSEYSAVPFASGILSSLSLKPKINGLILRKDDNYSISLTIRDGLNESMLDDFTGPSHSGAVKWEVSDPTGIEIIYPDTDDSTSIQMNALKAGNYSVKVTTTLNGVSRSRSANISVSDIPLKELLVKAPVSRLSNRSDGVQLGYSGVDTLLRPITLGNSVNWTLEPAGAGSIDNTGFYSPADTTFIGLPRFILTDNLSDKSAEALLTVFAEVSPEDMFTLSDKKGMELVIEPGSVQFPVEIFLDKTAIGPTKKQYTPVGQRTTYTVSDNLYKFQYKASVALAGDSLMKAATLNVPVDNSLRFFEGERFIGRYDALTKMWSIFPENTEALTDELSLNAFYKFGEYSVLSQNEPLGLKHVAVLPSPFSPQVGPVRIGYFLTTPERLANVTIKVYNVRGELVRTVLDNDYQTSGRYGSRAGIKEIFWDGLTDDGYMARNGRYIILITAKDGTGEKTEKIQVVLIK